MRKSTTRPVASKRARPKSDSPARVKTAVCISPESFKRLGACAIEEGMTQSEVIEYLIANTLSSYSVQVREGSRIRDRAGKQKGVSPAVSEDRHDLAAGVSAPTTNAA